MAPTIEELLRQLEESNRRAEEAEARADQATRERDLARREGEQDRRDKETLQQRAAPSRFLDYVRNAEEILFRTFHIPPALIHKSDGGTTKTYTTTSVDGKFYPRRLRAWDFESAHAAVFPTLVETFGDQPLFPALTDVLGVRRDLSPYPADEQDLRPFIRAAIEKPTARVVTEYLRLRREERTNRGEEDAEGGQGEQDANEAELRFVKITFQNNSFGLDLVQEDTEEEDKAPAAKKRRSPVKAIGIPDRWCVGFRDERSVMHVVVGEYKAAHKLPAQKLHAVLSRPPAEDFFLQAVKNKDVKTNETAAAAADDIALPPALNKKRQLTVEDVYIARVLCQAYHYMISSGLEFGYVASGDGLIFLRVLEDDPQTLLYFWSVFPVVPPAPERGREQDGSEAADEVAAHLREPHQTALAYLASLCMLAIRSTVRPMSWIDAREFDLARWPNPYNQATSRSLVVLLPAPSADRDGDRGDYRDASGGGSHGGSGGGASGGGGSRGSSTRSGGRKRPRSSSVSGNKTPASTRGIVVEPPTLPYCTQACLRGLCNGGLLDDRCPNVALHRAARKQQTHRTHQTHQTHQTQQHTPDKHPLTAADVRARITAQLARNMDKDCECMERWGLFGRCGVLFRLAVSGYGYTFVAKGVQAAHRGVLEAETAIYAALAAHQGRLIPVCLGLVHLQRPLPLHSLARIHYLMLLSYAGPPPKLMPLRAGAMSWQPEADRTEAELWDAGLRNDDVHPSNMAWNAEAGRMMQLDFDQAYMWEPKTERMESSEEPEQSEQMEQMPAPSALSAPPAPLSPTQPQSPLLTKRQLDDARCDGGDCSERPAAKRLRDASVPG